ncbi:Hypothetical protein KVN_LOCUS53 [uncultured virus]|nr:Hypothetical protein KVN_LOCUS53 [uncultured virus]
MIIVTKGHRFLNQITVYYLSNDSDQIKQSNKCEYEGDLICETNDENDDMPHGYGKLWSNEIGLKYTGNWLFGKFHGRGKLETIDKIYDGYFNNGVKQGVGILTLIKDGSKYVGNWENNLRHGIGTTILENKMIKSTWVNDKPTSNIISFSNGLKYYGDCNLNTLCHGWGVLYYPNGDYIAGNWENDKLNGYGYIYYKICQCVYCYNWKNSIPTHVINSYYY